MIVGNIDTKDISVVVQGAIDNESTHLVIKSIRKYLPDSEIILSTWEGSNINGLDYDILVLNKDPGASLCAPLEKRFNNLNRQIISTVNGIKKSSNQYCYKIRSDIILRSNNFLNYFDTNDVDQNSKYAIFQKKILMSSVWTRFRARINNNTMLQPYHISDWHMIGTKDDMLKLYDIELENDFDANVYYLYNKPEKFDAFSDHKWRYTPEQYIFYKCLLKKFPNLVFKSKLDYNEKHMELYFHLLAHNFIVIDKDMWSFTSFKHNLNFFLKQMGEDIVTYKKYLEICKSYTTLPKKKYTYKITKNKEKDIIEISNLLDIKNIYKEYNVITFDIFDTLLFRNVDPPYIPMSTHSLYTMMLLKRYNKDVTINNINYLRDTFIEIVKLYGKEEYLLDDAAEYILKYYHIDESKIQELKEFIINNEVEREINTLYLNNNVIEILEYLKQSNKKIFAISDMYLSKDAIIKILKHFDIYKYFDDIYVSSEYGALKHSGKLFKIFMSKENLLPNEFFHIGDNKISDYEIPKTLDIKALWYNDKTNLERKQKLSAFYTNFTNRDNILDKYFNINNEEPTSFEDFILKNCATDFINYVYELIIDAYDKSIEAIYFLERDGNIFYEIFNILIDKITLFKNLPKIDTYLVKISRKDSACLVNIENPYDVILRADEVNKPKEFTISHILGNFGLELDKLSEYINNHDNDINYFINNYAKTFYPLIKTKQNTVLEYIKNNKMFNFNNIALCDIGWGGTIQKDIIATFKNLQIKKTIYGYYYGADLRTCNISKYVHGYHIAENLHFGYSLLEFLIKKYGDIPKNTILNNTYYLNSISYNTILKQTDLFVINVNKYCLLPYIIKPYSQKKMIKFIKEPNINFLNMIRNVYFSLDRKIGDSYIKLIDKINNNEDIINMKKNAQWVEGSIKYSNINNKNNFNIYISKFLIFILSLFPKILFDKKIFNILEYNDRYNFHILKINICIKKNKPKL